MKNYKNILRTIEASKQRMMQYRDRHQHAQFIANFALRYFQSLHSLAIVENCLQAMFGVANANTNNAKLENAFGELVRDKLRTQVYDLLAIVCKSPNTNYSNAIQTIVQFGSANNLSYYEDHKAIAYAIEFFQSHVNDTAIVSIEALERAKTHDCDNLAAIHYSLHDYRKQASSIIQQQQYINAFDKFAILNMQACQALAILETNLETMFGVTNNTDEIDKFQDRLDDFRYDTFFPLQTIAHTTYANDYLGSIEDDTNCQYMFDYILLENMIHCDYANARLRLRQMQLSQQERNDYLKAIERFRQHAHLATLTSVEALKPKQRNT